MAFRTYKTSVASAVASGGTFTFSLGNAADWGQVKFQGGHTLYAEGLQALFVHPKDFTMSASSTTVTVTYNGTTSIPAGSTVQIQLEVGGGDNYLETARLGTLGGADYLGNPRWSVARPVRVNFGAPAAASATNLLSAVATADTALHAIAAASQVLDAPRTVQAKSSGADSSVVIVRGTDEYGVAIAEELTLNGTTAIIGNKAFKTVVSYQAKTALSNNLSLGTNNTFGLPFFVESAGGNGGTGIGYVLKEVADGATPSAGTLAGGDLTKATATTKDVRGVYTPNTTPDGAKNLSIYIAAEDVTFKGVPQFTE